MSNVAYINHDALTALIKSDAVAGKDYQVVDVRDEDFRGGNITGAIRAPSEARTDQTVQELVQKLEGVPKVIFHCTLSQVRGPKNARIYAEAVALKETQSSSASETQSGEAPATSDQTFSPNPYPNQEGKQQVLVLRDGFGNWQGLYRNDPQLVENFDSKVWSDCAP